MQDSHADYQLHACSFTGTEMFDADVSATSFHANLVTERITLCQQWLRPESEDGASDHLREKISKINKKNLPKTA